ncbi:MAG TPA: hypothetical protein VKD72_22680, partial [Gemmataceae bacterium]|nr:hypothetical protein [Gemmataceae bacterium]
HHAMARQVGPETSGELEERYRFHLAVQEIFNELTAYQNHVQQTLGQIAGQRQVAQEVFQATVGALQQARDAFEQKLQAADKLLLPPLKHMTAGAPLGKFLLDCRLVGALSAHTTTLDGKWVGRFMEQLNQVITKTRRIHFKSLGGILALQEKIAETWKARNAVPESAVTPTLP